MRKNLLPFATAFLLAGAAGTASAGGSSGSIGVGYEEMLRGPGGAGPGGASVVFDGGKFHAGGFVGFGNNDLSLYNADDSDVDFGGNFFFHVHSTAMSDFGIGGGLGLSLLNPPGPDNSAQFLYIDLGAQIRLFLASNVAISAGVGLSIAGSDLRGVSLGGERLGDVGIHYYFF